MARTDTLGHFLTDVADAIRTKTGSVDTIAASDFDTEIENIPVGPTPPVPPIYTPVEYVELTIEEYDKVKDQIYTASTVNTLIQPEVHIPAGDYDFYADFQFLGQPSGTSWLCFVGVSEKYMLNQNNTNTNQIRLFINGTSGSQWNTYFTANILNRHVYKKIKNYFFIDSSVGSSNIPTPYVVQDTSFGVIAAPMRFYRLILFKDPALRGVDENNTEMTILADFIPCKDENNVACVYDFVSNKLIYPLFDAVLNAGPEIST